MESLVTYPLDPAANCMLLPNVLEVARALNFLALDVALVSIEMNSRSSATYTTGILKPLASSNTWPDKMQLPALTQWVRDKRTLL